MKRVTTQQIEDTIVSEHYFTAAQGVIGSGQEVKFGSPLLLMTFCVLVLRNGFTVVGHSACADPDGFDAEIGRAVAREDAVNEIWPLLGYELRTQIHKESSGSDS